MMKRLEGVFTVYSSAWPAIRVPLFGLSSLYLSADTDMPSMSV